MKKLNYTKENLRYLYTLEQDYDVLAGFSEDNNHSIKDSIDLKEGGLSIPDERI